VGFEPTIAVLERANTVRALDRSATAIGKLHDERNILTPSLNPARNNARLYLRRSQENNVNMTSGISFQLLSIGDGSP
jgi:hypothetical protein